MSRRVYDEGAEVYYGGTGPYTVDYYRMSLTGPVYHLIGTTYGNRVPQAPAYAVHHLTHEDRLLRLERALELD